MRSDSTVREHTCPDVANPTPQIDCAGSRNALAHHRSHSRRYGCAASLRPSATGVAQPAGVRVYDAPSFRSKRRPTNARDVLGLSGCSAQTLPTAFPNRWIAPGRSGADGPHVLPDIATDDLRRPAFWTSTGSPPRGHPLIRPSGVSRRVVRLRSMGVLEKSVERLGGCPLRVLLTGCPSVRFHACPFRYALGASAADSSPRQAPISRCMTSADEMVNPSLGFQLIASE